MLSAALRCFMLMLCAQMLGACSEVRVYGAEEVRIHRFVGFTKIDVASAGKPVFVDTAVGAVLGGGNNPTRGQRHEHLAGGPAPAPGRRLHIPIHLRWGDLDAFNHVNNASMLKLPPETGSSWR